MKQICHRDLKLENTLLDGSPAPRLKICDFGYSKVYDECCLLLPFSVLRSLLFDSLLFFTRNQNQLLALLLTLHQRCYFVKNMMAR